MFTKIIGHENVKMFLEKSIANNRVAHAYLFIGPSRVGKMAVARCFAEAVLHSGKSITHSLEVHPDVFFVSRDVDPKTSVLKSNISVDQIRDLRERFSYTSLLPGFKIAIIDDAETMTTEAANALLKTLEEPRGKTVIILIVQDMRRVPETIVSRSQIIRFGLVRSEAIQKSLKDNGVAKTDAEKITRIVRGRPGLAMQLFQSKGELKEMLEEIKERKEVLGKSNYERLIWVENKIKSLKSKKSEEEFKLWRELCRDALLRSLGLRGLTTFDDYSAGDFSEIEKSDIIKERVLVLKRISEAEEALRSHVDIRMAIEHFLI